MGEQLEEVYYTPSHPGGYGGMRKLWKHSRLPSSFDEVLAWGRGQDAYTLHKNARQKFPRRVTEVASEGQQLQADLMDVRNHSTHNEGVGYILTCIDVFSKKAWALPVRSKSGQHVAEALNNVLENGDFITLQTDKGKEFYNENVRRVVGQHNVKHFSTENDVVKASIVERFNRTLRDKIYRYLTAKNTKRFLHALPDFINAYNSTTHSAIGVAPNDVGPHNREEINQRLYLPWRDGVEKSKINVGDYVRIAKHRTAFERGYTPNWTTELFIVDTKDNLTRPHTYGLKDFNGEIIDGMFYETELQVVKKPEVYQIERVIRTRRIRGVKHHLVKWLGYPDSFNSWVKDSDMV